MREETVTVKIDHPLGSTDEDNPSVVYPINCGYVDVERTAGFSELDKQRVVKAKYICYECGSYFRVKTKNRIKMVTDPKSFEPWFEDMPMSNPLNTAGYEDKVKAAQEKTGLKEAVTVGKALINGEPAMIGICDARFLMSSMGYVVGEKIARAVERATEEKLPVIIFTCSGGARMQEGIVSLMQMAKTSAALERHSKAGLLYVSVLTEPTTGGVTASFAMLGDIILADPDGVIVIPQKDASTILKDALAFQAADEAKAIAARNGTAKRDWVEKSLKEKGFEIIDGIYEP